MCVDAGTSCHFLRVEAVQTARAALFDTRSGIGSNNLRPEVVSTLLAGEQVADLHQPQEPEYLFTEKALNMRQLRWLEYMEDYDCTIEYTAGKGNTVADALSRMYTGMVRGGESTVSYEDASLTALWHRWSAWEKEQIYTPMIRPEWVESVREAQSRDPILRSLSGKEARTLRSSFEYREGLLYFKGRLYIPDDQTLQNDILEEAHSSRLSVHLGSEKMYHNLRSHF